MRTTRPEIVIRARATLLHEAALQRCFHAAAGPGTCKPHVKKQAGWEWHCWSLVVLRINGQRHTELAPCGRDCRKRDWNSNKGSNGKWVRSLKAMLKMSTKCSSLGGKKSTRSINQPAGVPSAPRRRQQQTERKENTSARQEFLFFITRCSTRNTAMCFQEG